MDTWFVLNDGKIAGLNLNIIVLAVFMIMALSLSYISGKDPVDRMSRASSIAVNILFSVIVCLIIYGIAVTMPFSAFAICMVLICYVMMRLGERI